MLAAGNQFNAGGGWADGTGWEFDLTLRIRAVSVDVREDGAAVEAEAEWALRAVPDDHRDEFTEKIGATATEYIRGAYTEPMLALEGYRTEDPSHIIHPGKYQLLLIENGKQARGTCAGVKVRLFKAVVLDDEPVTPQKLARAEGPEPEAADEADAAASQHSQALMQDRLAAAGFGDANAPTTTQRTLKQQPPLQDFASDVASEFVPDVAPPSESSHGGQAWEDAMARHAAGDLDEAERIYAQLYRELSTAEADRADHSLQNMAVIAEQRHDYARADELYGLVESRRMAKLKPGDKPDQLLLRARMGIVNVLDELGESKAAAKLCHEVVAVQTDTLGASHADTLRSQMNLAGLVADAAAGGGGGGSGEGPQQGDLADRLLQMEKRQAAALGADHPDVIITRFNRGVALAEVGEHEEAAALVQSAAEALARQLGGDHPDVLR
eukprot:SAG22_NODE_97_length_20760_cov_43.302850_6_plen_441_part_00